MNADDPKRKKQLGQYFTGIPVASLLAALADARSATSIIDPMAGIGDMLNACLEVGATPAQLVGIDLDPLAIDRARQSLEPRGGELHVGDAFAGPLPTNQFDLVITNPPYIRYQSKSDSVGVPVPTAQAIRKNLIAAVKNRQDLSQEAKDLFVRVASEYPGTSDVAVPAWILSAALVAEGGVLAVLVPQAWLSRNYAAPLREMLARAFDIQFIFEDGDASWFDDAQVRTHLVVAKRRPVDGTTSRSRAVTARATKELVTDGRLKGSLEDEYEVAARLSEVVTSRSHQLTDGLAAHVQEPARSALGSVSGDLAALVARSQPVEGYRTLESYGWRCGQGLRTGANEFFYVSADGQNNARTAARWRIRDVPVPAQCLIPVIRRQSELGNALEVLAADLGDRLLNLRGWATLEDAQRTAGPSKFKTRTRSLDVVPERLADWISEVATTPFAESDPTRLIPHLSAVAPNVKIGRDGEPLAFWYQIPALAPRHQPELLLPRVCGGRTAAYSNPDRVVVDANFSTLWRTEDDALHPTALLALLNSTWVWANLESNCTVLGGGALKVEATDLRRLTLPHLDAPTISDLMRLGKALVASDDRDATLSEIDWIVTNALVGPIQAEEVRAQVSAIASRKLSNRSR